MKTSLRAFSAAALLLIALHASAERMLEPAVEGDEPNYAAGTKALNEHRYLDAVTNFDKSIATKGDRAQGAYYWKAYALKRLHRIQDAKATCDALHAKFPDSPWNNDCGAMMVDVHISIHGSDVLASIPPMPPTPPLPPLVMRGGGNSYTYTLDSDGKHDPGYDIKILALNSVLREDPEKALPELRTMLNDSKTSSGMKKHALFMLTQSKNPEAQRILDDAIRGKMGPDLQRQAIGTVPIFQGKRVNDALVDAYKSTSDNKVKESVVTGLFISQDAPRMVEIARSEKDLELKRRIVSQLALMHDKAAQDYMLELLK